MADLDPALVEQAAKAMEAHRRYDGGQIGVDCECGETFREFPAYDAHDRHAARAVLEAVAPAIAAQALRDAADELRSRGTTLTAEGRRYCSHRLVEMADRIEKEEK